MVRAGSKLDAGDLRHYGRATSSRSNGAHAPNSAASCRTAESEKSVIASKPVQNGTRSFTSLLWPMATDLISAASGHHRLGAAGRERQLELAAVYNGGRASRRSVRAMPRPQRGVRSLAMVRARVRVARGGRVGRAR